MHARLYKPGTDVIDITAPGGIAALLAFHRRTFGSAVMEDDPDDDEDDDDADDGEPKLNEHGFPDKTPWKEMKPEHQAAYWRHQSKRHETRANSVGDYDKVKTELDNLKAKHQTDDEKAAEEAKTQVEAAARADERAKLAPKLVAAEFKTVAAGHMPAGQLDALIAGAHAPNFLTADGEVDTDKVTEFLEPFMKDDDGDGDANGKKKWPDMGQGRRSSKKAKGVSAGAALYADRHTKK